jgi:ribosomal protein L29
MTERTQGTLSERLRSLSTELRELEVDLKTGETPETGLLQEFREALDNARMTAWTVSELANAAEAQKDAARVLTFLAAERLRRSTQMLKDLCADLDEQSMSWQTSGVQGLYETVNVLQVQLGKMIDQHRGRFEKVKAKDTRR